MGMGRTSEPPSSAREWNSGSCDVMAVALHRMYGLPLMAEFELGSTGGKEALGYLMHAWVRLPDGRALDAAGPKPMFTPTRGGDPDDDWVVGYRIVEMADGDPHLLDIREEEDYVESIRTMRAPRWIWENLGPQLSALGIEPRGYRSELGLPPVPDGYEPPPPGDGEADECGAGGWAPGP